MPDKLLEVKHLKKYFNTKNGLLHAVDDVSFDIERGETLGLVGESGCGKSTLARLITRIEKPDGGSIWLCGSNLTSASGGNARRVYSDMKMIFQEPRSSFDPRLTLGASIKVALKAAGIPKAERQPTTENLLREVGLDESYAKMRPTDVSGGECQRAAIARAIAAKPKLLICDEATSALDVSVQAQIMELLRSLKEKHSMSFLFISHDLALVSGFCTRTYVMYSGEIVEQGKTMDIITTPKNEYTKALISSVLLA